MRYADADHIDMGSFYARRPTMGKYYRVLGYVIIVLACLFSGDQARIGGLLICTVLAWLQAWYRVVGALWRSSLVAAAVLCAAILTLPAIRQAYADWRRPPVTIAQPGEARPDIPADRSPGSRP